MKGSPVEEADRLKTEFNVAIHCIGIGYDVAKSPGGESARTELKLVASEPEKDHVFIMPNFATLDELTSVITVTQTGRPINSFKRHTMCS